jgi:hypothetical protein
MNGARADDDKYSVVMASEHACGMVTSMGDRALRFRGRSNFIAEVHRLDEGVILERWW